MSIQANITDLDGRRLVGPAAFYLPVFVSDRDGKQIGKFKSPRKFSRAVISGAIVLVDGDRIVVGGPGVLS